MVRIYRFEPVLARRLRAGYVLEGIFLGAGAQSELVLSRRANSESGLEAPKFHSGALLNGFANAPDAPSRLRGSLILAKRSCCRVAALLNGSGHYLGRKPGSGYQATDQSGKQAQPRRAPRKSRNISKTFL
jgi:hypothetical protein